jgi:zinc protease
VSPLLLIAALSACAPSVLDVRPAPLPEPLKVPEFALPTPATRTLANGVSVVIAENHEVPLFEVRVLFRAGGFTDPAGKEALASVTLDMVNEGVEGMTAEEFSRASKRLGASVATGADSDGAEIGLSGITENLDASLDLLAKVMLAPTFPTDDWDVMRARRMAAVKNDRENPPSIASRVTTRLLWEGAYRGQLVTESSLAAITTDDMRAWRATHLVPSEALILVGGDVDPDEITQKLDARLAAWTDAAGTPPVVPAVRARTSTLYLVDKPGAAQSVVRVLAGAPTRLDADRYDMTVASLAFGGAFMSRLNLNLREEKGYTYGARCGLVDGFGPSFLSCTAQVATDVTGPSLTEIAKELDGALGGKPFTPDEVTAVASGEILGFPRQFELTGAILGQRGAIWRYALPEDYTERYVPGLRAVTADSATKAFRQHVRTDQLTWLVVGDAAKIGESVKTLGLPVVMLDRDGNALSPDLPSGSLGGQ